MTRTRRIALIGAAVATAAIAAGATLPALAHGGDGMRGARGPAFDFEAVAGGAASVDRDQAMEFGMERLAAFDTDGDGRLDREELAAALPQRETPGLMVFARDRREAMLDRMMARFDAEDGGAVPIEAIVRRQVDMIFARLDRDGDGVITAEEAERPMRRAGRWMHRGHGE